jgi:hypothetical protein
VRRPQRLWLLLRGARPRRLSCLCGAAFVRGGLCFCGAAFDESEVFASYLPYRTREPRPVAGSAGLVPKSWDAALDQWGADQLQSRFIKMFSRRMTALDGEAWTAGRMSGCPGTIGRSKNDFRIPKELHKN